MLVDRPVKSIAYEIVRNCEGFPVADYECCRLRNQGMPDGFLQDLLVGTNLDHRLCGCNFNLIERKSSFNGQGRTIALQVLKYLTET